MRGNFYFSRNLLLSFVVFLGSCGAQKYQDEVTKRRLISWIDERQYLRVISYLEFEATFDERERFRSIEAQAHMGMGGFEMLSIVEALKGPMTYSRTAFSAMSKGCPVKAISAKDIRSLPSRCLMVRLFNVLPSAQDSHLQRAQEVWSGEGRVKPVEYGEDDRILSTTFEASLLVSRSGKILADFYDLSVNPLQAEEVDELFAEIKLAAESSRDWLDQSLTTARLLNRRFLGAESSNLFESKVASKIEFSRKTGLPKLISIADMANQGVEERVMRANIVRTLEDILVDYFKVTY